MANLIEFFEPLTDAASVFALWHRCLGHSYLVSERVFWQNTCGNPGYEAGDGFVIRRDGDVVGFSLTRIDRRANPQQTPSDGAISVLLVDPAHEGQGLGTELLGAAESRLRQQEMSKVNLGRSTNYRFWPGVPTEMESAHTFFASRGYEMQRGTFDLVRHLGDYEHPPRIEETLNCGQVLIEPAQENDVAELLSFERREFSGWEQSMRLMCAVGDVDQIVVVRDQGEIIGSLQTFSPRSRFRAANIVWERLLGEDVGGIGAVGITESERGRGLGLAMCSVASDLLKNRGVGNCLIDWTGLINFYGKLGYQPWREYWMGSKEMN